MIQTKSGESGSFSGSSPYKKLRDEVNVWISKAAPDGLTPHQFTMDLTPEMANALLEKNDDNRPIKESEVIKTARDILSGKYKVNGQNIIIALDGYLNDGQHRCLAVIKANKPARTCFCVGVDRDSRTTLDQGSKRSVSDQLAMSGVKNSALKAAIAKYAVQYFTYSYLNRGSRYSASQAEIINYLYENEDEINRAVVVVGHKRESVALGRPICATMYYLIRKVVGQGAYVDTFFDALLYGANLPHKSPITYCRVQLIANRYKHAEEKAELIIRAWNYYRSDPNKPVAHFKVQGGELPQIAK